MIYVATSDLHIADDPAHRAKVARHIEGASQLGRLLVAGDLLDAWTLERMEWARRRIPKDAVCVPGNHDYAPPGMTAGATGTDPDAVGTWARAWWHGGESRAWAVDATVLSADSCQIGGGFTSRGIHGNDGYDLAESLGDRFAQSMEWPGYTPGILLCHHDPRVSSPTPAHPFLDWPMGGWVIKWAREHGIWCIVCGHVSMPLIECVDGLTFVNCNDSLSSGKVAVVDSSARTVREVVL